jgi:alkanesulfonate monooxygenase SsuD/methylene tetrahydromethanopterin reductase-like flavin-dependent oxidoreductase (luciferase family)
MKLGMALGNFSWPVPASELGTTICRLARQADEAGFDSLWVMDHFFQIRVTGNPPESPMPEAYATLGVLAGQTKRIRLGTLVTSVAYRHPGVLVKTVTTLDVLSAGRMYFGVGAGAPFNVPPSGPGTAFEAEGLGIPLPPLADRFEMLEELLQVAHQMWRGDDSPYTGKHYQLVRPLNSPNSVQRPRPPILVAGGGERKTLRLVARYADALGIDHVMLSPRGLWTEQNLAAVASILPEVHAMGVDPGK